MGEQVKAEVVEEKKPFNGKVFGILSLCLSPLGNIASIVFGVLSIIFGKKSKTKLSVTMGIWGIILHVVLRIISLIISCFVIYLIVNYVQENGGEISIPDFNLPNIPV